MRPDQDELDDEIRGHMAISLKERIERGEDPEAARLAALKEFGNVTLTRDSIRRVWRPRGLDAAEALVRDIRFAMRSLLRVKGLAATVVVTPPSASAPTPPSSASRRAPCARSSIATRIASSTSRRGAAAGASANWRSRAPEIDDIKARVKTLSAFGFSIVDFTMRSQRGASR
jgi:hypothetical protein